MLTALVAVAAGLGVAESPGPPPTLPYTFTHGTYHWVVIDNRIPVISDQAIVACTPNDICFTESPSTQTPVLITNHGQTLTPVSLPPRVVGFAVTGVDCPTTSDCQTIGVSQLAVKQNGHYTTVYAFSLLSSLDGGLSWSDHAVFSESASIQPPPFTCSDTTHCLAVIYADNGAVTVVEHTENGGRTWSYAPIPGVGGLTSVWLSCPTVTSCLLTGVNGSTAYEYVTHNNGSTLTKVTVPKNTAALVRLFCTSAERCWVDQEQASTGDIRLLTSDDGGQSWAIVPEAQTPGGVSGGPWCANNNHCWMFVDYTSTANFLIETTDGGLHWKGHPLNQSAPLLPSAGYVQPVACNNPHYCFGLLKVGNIGYLARLEPGS